MWAAESLSQFTNYRIHGLFFLLPPADRPSVKKGKQINKPNLFIFFSYKLETPFLERHGSNNERDSGYHKERFKLRA